MKYLLPLLVLILWSEIFADTLEKSSVKINKESRTGSIEFIVDKSLSTTMNEIVNIELYPKKIDDIEAVEVYERDTSIIKAKVYVNNFFISFSNRVVHTVDYENHTFSWRLDEDEENYFQVMTGFWKLTKEGNKTRVYYENHLEFKGWIPSFLENYLIEKGLSKSTEWLYTSR